MKTLTPWLCASALLCAATPSLAQEPEPNPAAALKANASASGSIEKLGYHPLFQFAFGGMELEFPLRATERLETVSDIPIDASGGQWSGDPAWNTQVRVGARLDTKYALAPLHALAEFEMDVLTGQHAGGALAPELGVDLPASGDTDSQLRKAMLRLDFGYHVHLMGGAMTSHWGMGLLANDGAHGGEFGSAQFLDPRGGDRVLRGMLLLGPVGDGKWAFAAAADKVLDDDILVGDDEAQQAVVSVIYGFGEQRHAGIYAVARQQEAQDGKITNVGVLDAEGTYHRDLGGGHQIDLQTEVALIFGSTDLAPSVDYPEHDVLQFGGAARFGYHIDNFGLWMDLVYASGDNNLDDDRQTGFKMDPNFPQGLLLHRYVMAAQSGRAPLTAGNPDLVGVAAEDLDRFSTRGSITNTLSLFPRLYGTFWDRLEVYGGPLVALSDRDMVDPLETRLAGGQPRNALGGKPGAYLGTELDAGMRYRLFLSSAEVLLGVEGGVFLPGSAFEDAQGESMDNVSGGRAYLRLRL